MTARHVAAQRAQLFRPAGPHGDPDAERRLEASLGGWLRLLGRGGVPMAARTTFFDAQTQAAVSSGITQVVIIGAGYDGRALRFAEPGVRFFEVDHPATQADKARRLARVGADTSAIELLAVDLTSEDLGDALAGRGHDMTLLTLFICEGLFAYLTRDVIYRMLRSLRQRAAPGSTLACNFFIRPKDARRRAFASRTAVDMVLRAIGEPRRSVFRPGEPERLLGASGWHVRESIEADHESDHGYAQFIAANPA